MNFTYDTVYLTEKDTQAQILSPIVGCKHTQNWMPCYSSDKKTAVVPLQGHVSGLVLPFEYDPTFKKWNEDTIYCFPNEFIRKPSKGKEAIYNRAVSHVRSAKKVVIATDFDAEGAAMAMNIIKAADAEDRVDYMLHMGSMQPAALKKALKEKPYIDYKSLAKAGLSRAELDWVEGMSYSRALTFYLAKNRVKLNYGGLQSPIVSMVVERDLQFENHKNLKYYTLDAQAKFNEKKFNISIYKKIEEENSRGELKLVKNEKFETKDQVESLINRIKENNSFTVSSYSKKTTKENPKQLYTQSALQVVAGEKLNLDPVKTLELTQAGYLQSKTNSYPRTEIPYISREEYADVPVILKNISELYFKDLIDDILSKAIPERKSVFDFTGKEVTSHGAITPTVQKFSQIVPSLSEEKQELFKIIAKRYIENFMDAAESISTSGEIPLFDNVYASFTETQPVKAGFKIVERPDYEETIKNYIPIIPADLKKGSELILGAFNIKEGETKPKPRFTLSSLVKALEKVSNLYPDDKIIQESLKGIGIGTGATRAPTIDHLFKVVKEGEEPWLVKKGKQVISTEKARKFHSVLPKELISPLKRAYFQKDIKLVEQGEMSIEQLRGKYRAQLKENIEMIKDYAKDPNNIFLPKKANIVPIGKCPSCGQGEVYKKGKVYMCSAAAWKNEGTKETPKWKNEGCKYTIFNNSLEKYGKKSITQTEVKKLLSNGSFVATLYSTKTEKEYKKDVKIDNKWGIQVDFKSNPK